MFTSFIAFDLSKAFDSVRQHSLTNKVANFTLLDYLYNWIVNNATDSIRQNLVAMFLQYTLLMPQLFRSLL